MQYSTSNKLTVQLLHSLVIYRIKSFTMSEEAQQKLFPDCWAVHTAQHFKHPRQLGSNSTSTTLSLLWRLHFPPVCTITCKFYIILNIIYKSCFASFPTFSLWNGTGPCYLLNTIRWANFSAFRSYCSLFTSHK